MIDQDHGLHQHERPELPVPRHLHPLHTAAEADQVDRYIDRVGWIEIVSWIDRFLPPQAELDDGMVYNKLILS